LYAAFDVISLFLAYPHFPVQTPFLPQNFRFHLLKNADILDGSLDLAVGMPLKFSFRSALMKGIEERVPDGRCSICREDFENREFHVWNHHSDELFSIFKLAFDLPFAINDIVVGPSGKLSFGGKEFQSFTSYFRAWKSKSKTKSNNRKVNCKELFVKYLEKTRRITGNECRICHQEVDNIADHCWDSHSDLLIEWLPSGSISLSKMNENENAVNAAWHFLFRLKLYRLIGEVCECNLCGWRFLGPVSLVCHSLMKHIRIRIATRERTRSCRTRDLARDLIACSAVLPNGWDSGIDNCCSWIGNVKESPIVCKNCNLEFPDLLGMRMHLLRKHLLVELKSNEGGEEPQEVLQQREIKVKSTNLYVRGFNLTMTDERLLKVFSEFGKLRNARVQKDANTGVSKQFGFVCFEHLEDAERCIRESVLLRFEGKPAYVTEKVSQAERQEGGGIVIKDVSEKLRKKISVVRPETLQYRLLGHIKKISEQQMSELVEDEELFERWVKLWECMGEVGTN
jgi:hypothetical protein